MTFPAGAWCANTCRRGCSSRSGHRRILRWAFVGGTALRFLYSIPRFSEDLDFSLIHVGEDAGFRTALAEVKRALSLEDYRVEMNVKDEKTVSSAWLKFPGLPYEIGMSPHTSQVLSIKLEVDTRPPPGADRDIHCSASCNPEPVSLRQGVAPGGKTARCADPQMGQRSRPLRPGLVFVRPYLAGAQPGIAQRRLAQTGWKGPAMTAGNWRAELRQRLEALDWEGVRADVRPFLERERDIALVSAETLGILLETGGT